MEPFEKRKEKTENILMAARARGQTQMPTEQNKAQSEGGMEERRRKEWRKENNSDG